MRVPSVAQSVPQQKLLVAAVATACALPAAALAQLPAGVEVYGRANVSYERITVSNSPVSAQNVSNWEVVDNSSRIGIRGNATPSARGW